MFGRHLTVLRFLFIVLCSVILIPSCWPQNGYAGQRERMVKTQIANRGVRHEATLKAMRDTPRHSFVPSAQVVKAYWDTPLPIGYGQTISQPYIVGYMTEVIDPKAGQKVLEVGTGSGYQAAVLAQIVDSVFTIEIVKELGEKARDRLESLHYQNVLVKIDDGYFGWEEHAPFDAIIVTAAAEFVPPPLIKQLKEGGKMIIPIGSPFAVQNLVLVTIKNGKPVTKNLFPVRFVPFTRE